MHAADRICLYDTIGIGLLVATFSVNVLVAIIIANFIGIAITGGRDPLHVVRRV